MKMTVETVNSPIEDDIFIKDEIVIPNGRNPNPIQDHQSSVMPPKDSYVRDFSTSGSFLERRELLAGMYFSFSTATN